MLKDVINLLNLIPATQRWIIVVAIVAGLTYYQTQKIGVQNTEEMRVNLENIVQFVAKNSCKE